MHIISIDTNKIPETLELYEIKSEEISFIFYIRKHKFELKDFDSQLKNKYGEK